MVKNWRLYMVILILFIGGMFEAFKQWKPQAEATTIIESTDFKDFDFHDGFYPHEIDSLNRLLHIMQAENPTSKENVVARHDFYLYVGQHDTRNASNFLTVFPEFTAFYNRCKNEYEASVVAKALQVAYLLEQEQ